MKTLAARCKLHVVLSPADADGFADLLAYRFTEIDKIVGGVDARDAQISKVDDREYILGEVAKLEGGLGAVTETVCAALRGWLKDEGRAALARLPAAERATSVLLLACLGLLLQDMGKVEEAKASCSSGCSGETQGMTSRVRIN